MTTATELLDALATLLGPQMAKQNASRYAYGGGFGYGYKHDVAGGSSGLTQGYSHGPGGLLTFPGVDPAVFNASMGIRSALASLPTMPSLYTDPTYFTVTGVTGDTGDEKNEVCDDAPVAGLMKGCLTHSVFGRYERSTAELEINRLGQRVDRADPLDLTLVNSPMANAGLWGAGPFNPNNPADVLTNEVSRKFWERNVSIHRLLTQQLWRGNPANNASYPGGGYKEMTSFPVLVRTGYIDAETNVACPAMDSYISNFNYGRVDAGDSSIVASLTNIFHQLKFRADRGSVNPVRWVIFMRHSLFYELTSIWPCSYLSYRCAVSPGMVAPMQGVIDAQQAVEMRDAMRAGSYLLIDGERYEVVTDDGILELSGNDSGGNFPAGCFSSDIYVIPMSVVGGRAVTYMEYFQYQNPSIESALGNMILGRIEGAFITWPRQTNLCVQWQSKIEPRLVMRTPWLAGRLQNVAYCPIEHERDVFPNDPYFADGGKTTRVGTSLYDLWDS